MINAAQVIGTWRMLSWKREFVETGDHLDSLGPEPIGFVTYTSDGRVHAIVAQSSREKPAHTPPSDADKIRLYDSMLAYSGTYELFDDRVVHRPDVSWNQIWTGTDQIRYFKFEGDRLQLWGPPAIDPYSGKQVIQRMTFEKWVR
jgi:hypothetical protein